MGQQATREDVLAWMHREGAGAKRARTHFDIPLGTIKGWKRWAAKSGWQPPSAQIPPQPPPGNPSSAPRSGGEGGITSSGRVPQRTPPTHPPNPPGAPPPPTPSTGRTGRGSGGAGSRSASPQPPARRSGRGGSQLDAGDLDAEAARLLRQSSMRLLRYLAGELEEELPPVSDDQREALKGLGLLRLVERAEDVAHFNPQQIKAAAGALKTLLDSCPNILTLKEKTTPNQGGSGGTDTDPGEAADDLAEALGLEAVE